MVLRDGVNAQDWSGEVEIELGAFEPGIEVAALFHCLRRATTDSSGRDYI
jgi:hypothetical protein